MRARLAAPALASLLLAIMFVLAGGAALRESVTIDEVAHIASGLTYWQKLDLRLNEEHPPLAKLLAALPLAIRGTRVDYASPAWTVSRDFIPGYVGEWIIGDLVLTRWNDPWTTLAWARLPMLLLTIALGWLVFAIARRLGGDWGGLLCVAVYASTPVLLVFGPLVLTDVPIAFCSLLALLAMAKLWDDPGRRNTRLMALALAGAILTKFTGAILFFAFIALSLSMRWWPLGDQARKPRWQAMRLATWWAALAVYAGYFLLSIRQPMNIPGLEGNGLPAAILGRFLMPLWVFLRGLGWVVVTGNRPTYILGHAYPHGVWFYFPVLLVLKSAPGFLTLLALAIAVAARAKWRRWPHAIPKDCATLWRLLWVSLSVYAGICILSHFDVSFRHFITPLVLLILMLAPLPRLIGRTPALAWLTALLVASCVLTAVRAYPYFFPYLIPLAGGRPGYWLVNDSNLDWNHALPEVKQFAERRGLRDVPVDIYGFSDLRPFVPQGRLWDCQAPTEADAGKVVVVSANAVLDSHNCGWLLQYPHEDLAGGSMLAVTLPPTIPPAGAPGGPPPLEARRLFLGFPFEMRQLFLRLEQQPEDIAKTVADLTEAQMKLREAKKK